MPATLLIEIGCEEIPARMIPGAAADLEARAVAVLDQAGLAHGPSRALGGARRLAVLVEAVAEGLSGRAETVLGPPAAAAFGADDRPTPAAVGFARKQGIDPALLRRVETERGNYAGFVRDVPGRSAAEILAGALPAAVSGMTFPKTMRWGSGRHRWVRPVHWIVALHGAAVVDLEIFGVRSGRVSEGHRFLAGGSVAVPDAGAYVEALRSARVLVDPEERRSTLQAALERAAAEAGGRLVPDAGLLDEARDLVEWPGVVAGGFDPAFLALPREILVTTLRHHQKSFSVEGRAGLLPVFLSVANTDRDPAGHIRRGNEWVVVGRLDDARFFWDEDRKRTVHARIEDLTKVTFHVKAGSYGDKAVSMERLADRLASRLGLHDETRRRAVDGARLAKADLVTGLVGEFPELQGIVGGLLLGAEGADAEVARAVYEQYRPAGADDAIPGSDAACVVSVADRLDTIGALLAAGEAPTGSRDPFGLRRAANGVLRIAIERRWPVSLEALATLSERRGAEPSPKAVLAFLSERLQNYLRDRGFTPNEVSCVMLAAQGDSAPRWPLHEIVARLQAIAEIRGRDDFAHLVDLTKRVANIRRKNAALVERSIRSAARGARRPDPEPAVRALEGLLEEAAGRAEAHAGAHRFGKVVDELAALVAPVDLFFEKALVVDPDDPETTDRRLGVLGALEAFLTRHFDIRELAGQADSKR